MSQNEKRTRLCVNVETPTRPATPDAYVGAAVEGPMAGRNG